MIQFRKATSDDLELLVLLRINDLKMFSSKEIQEPTIQAIRNFYAEQFSHQLGMTLLGYDQELCIASATLYQYQVMPSNDNPTGKVGQLTNVWVDEAYRHQGIASQMVKELIHQNYHKVGMFCLNSSPDGIKLYEKCGFMKKANYFVMYTE